MSIIKWLFLKASPVAIVNCIQKLKVEFLIEIWYDGAGFYFDATRRSGGELWAAVCFDKFRAIDTNWLPL